MNATLAGIYSILIWGISIPIVRIIEHQIGAIAYIGAVCLLIAVFGGLNLFRLRLWPNKEVFKNPYLYARWLFFSLHLSLLIVGVGLVSHEHVPFIILLNYLWPTSIIICSILIAGVCITRWWAFILGTVIVIASLVHEILGPEGLSKELFASQRDCMAYAVVFLGAISWGMYSAISRRTGEATGAGTVIPIFQFTLALFLPISFLPNMATWDQLAPWGLPFLIVYGFAQFLAYLSWDLGMRKGNVVFLSLCADVIPWLSLVSAHLLLGVEISTKTVISAITLVLGASITRYGTLQKRAKPSSRL